MDFEKINIKNKVHNRYDNLIKVKKLQVKNILIGEKDYKYFSICFVRYDYRKLITMLSFY